MWDGPLLVPVGRRRRRIGAPLVFHTTRMGNCAISGRTKVQECSSLPGQYSASSAVASEPTSGSMWTLYSYLETPNHVIEVHISGVCLTLSWISAIMGVVL
jgi:hypothetical protein